MPVLERGALIAQRYRVIGRLGSGGMASVYECHDEVSGWPVALKLLHDHLLADNPEVVQRFRQESQLMQRLSRPAPHPNIAAVYDVIVEPKTLAIVMELITDGGLDEYLAHEKRLTEANAIKLCLGILSGLQFVHAHHILHRDLKLSNILLAFDEQAQLVPKIADFGIAKAEWNSLDAQSIAKLTQTQSMFGSPAYMAPELFDSAISASPRSDLYAVGIMLYELLVGELPFVVDSMPSHVMRVSTQAAPSPRKLRPELSGDVERVLAKALAKDPEERFRSADDFAAALEGRLADVSGEFPTHGADADPLVIGQDYQVVQRIGRGPSSTVYRCVDPSLGVDFAVKLLRSNDANKRQRLVLQAQAQAPLHQGRPHPGIVAIRNIVSDGLHCALVLELVDGISLDRYLNETKPEIATIARLFQEAAEALAYAHSLSLLHRNLRPSNLLVAWSASDDALRRPARLKLSDFGMDAIAGLSPLELAQRSFALPFLAPELHYGAAPSTASDVYALCALMLFAVLGKLPEQANTPGQLRSLVPALDEPLAGLLHAALDDHPERRPSAEEFARTLATLATAAPSNTILPEPSAAPNRSNRLWLLAAFVSLLLLGAGAALLATITPQATPATQPAVATAQPAELEPDASPPELPAAAPELPSEPDVFDEVEAFFSTKTDLAVDCLVRCASKRKKGQVIEKGLKIVEAVIHADAEGHVVDVVIERDDLAMIELGDCVREAILSWKLPSPGSPREWKKDWKIDLSQTVK